MHTLDVSNDNQYRVKIQNSFFPYHHQSTKFKFKHMFLTQKYIFEWERWNLAGSGLNVLVRHALYLCVLAYLFYLLGHSAQTCNIKIVSRINKINHNEEKNHSIAIGILKLFWYDIIQLPICIFLALVYIGISLLLPQPQGKVRLPWKNFN